MDIKEVKKLFILLGVLAILLFGTFLTVMICKLVWAIDYKEKEVEIDLDSEIEKAIKVARIENKIIKIVTAGGLLSSSVGVGVGLGAPQITVSSPQEFLSLVPPAEPIYVSLEIEKEPIIFSLKKIYLAFLKNRAGVVVYEKIYSYREGEKKFWLKDYSWDKAIFHWDNRETVETVSLGIFTVGTFIFLGLAFLLLRLYVKQG